MSKGKSVTGSPNFVVRAGQILCNYISAFENDHSEAPLFLTGSSYFVTKSLVLHFLVKNIFEGLRFVVVDEYTVAEI